MRRNNDLVKLYGDAKMPVLGLGTAMLPYHGETVDQAVRLALKLGYRHFDTAKIYGSEAVVGKALMEEINGGKVKRKDVFVTSKLWGSDHHDPVSALKQTLRNSGMDYLDLYLVHWPAKLKKWANCPVPEEGDFEELDMETTWSGMEKCLELGLCKSIGVSNFSCKKIEQLLEYASIKPSVNQVEMHPMWRQNKLRKFCREHKIHVSAYSPLGGAGSPWGTRAIVDNPIIQSIALKHKATSAQVALSWGLSKGASMITKSFNQERMKENMKALELKLDDEDVHKIERLNEWKIMRGEFLVNETTSPYRSIQDLWDDEI
ncbi:Methylecgonone reductase [Thalictrum thalictroides]|uniref:codeinone reductase (NADPH) n=1 Tax=Thalictrum thalictroides TaxID=46969 RepID=A0A7J6XF50_THATH|nr:Methylecgonone reductase [Thalictrum thalictroides]